MSPREHGVLCGVRTSLLDLAALAAGEWPRERPRTRQEIGAELRGIAQALEELLDRRPAR